MSYFSPETQITQSGQAIKLNAMALNSLCQIYETNIGPFGTLKMLITPSGSIKSTKDGSVLSREIQFSHPTAILVNRLTNSLYVEVGDGTSSFVVLCCKTFLNGFKYFNDGCSIHKILISLEIAKKSLVNYLKTETKPLEEDTINKLAFNGLATKVEANTARILSNIVFKAIENIKDSKFFDTNMIEIMKMGEGDVNQTKLIEGLVLDHAGRHALMPKELSDVAILITNISLEYEKPEVNSAFYYSSASQREKMVESERAFILERANKIAEFARYIREKESKSLLVISERGIDPFSLEVLAAENILALRRAKRRNLERLIKMCGGNLVSKIEDLDIKNLGFCGKAYVKSIGEEKYTFIENTPFKESCTILVRGSSDLEMEKIVNAIKSTIKSISHAIRDKVFIRGGLELYSKLVDFMDSKSIIEDNNVGFMILKDTYLDIMKILIRNSGRNVEQEIGLIKNKKFVYEKIEENFCVVLRVLVNSCTAAMNLLLVDEIIRAGKPVNEEKHPRE